MASYHFLIKPASSLCNMRCGYCFYRDEAEMRSVRSLGVMSLATANALIEKAFTNATSKDSIGFAFQGGEPTLAGKGFYRSFVAEVSKRNTMTAQVVYAIQTNALDLDAEWIALFRQNHFLVGVSVDGDINLHDSHRVDASGKGTWIRVTRNLDKLIKAGIEVNLLCVVTKQCARRAHIAYDALKKLGTGYLQFIACLDPLESLRGTMPYSLLPDEYGIFLCHLFDAWYKDWESGNYTSIRLFDDLVHLSMGLPAGTCSTDGCCGAYFVVEGDGSVYPCDFYALDRWKMGNINTNTLEELALSPASQEFLRKGLQKPEKCGSCSFLHLCNGGCKRDWIEADGASRNYYCEAFQMLFSHAGSRIKHIARLERSFM